MASFGEKDVLGTVYLVGAGPGDPGLVTVRGKRLIAEADVIFYDHLSPVFLLQDARPEAKTIYVGKKRAEQVRTQEEISELLIAEARVGRMVVRLKGGDPFMFGRGGEEAEAMVAAGVPFEVVPGVTSALGSGRLFRDSADTSAGNIGGELRQWTRRRADRLGEVPHRDARHLHGPDYLRRDCGALAGGGA